MGDQLQQGQLQAIAHQAALEGYQQVAQLQAAERLYPQMAPYLGEVQESDYQDVTAPPQPSVTPPPMATATPRQPAMPVTPRLKRLLTPLRICKTSWNI